MPKQTRVPTAAVFLALVVLVVGGFFGLALDDWTARNPANPLVVMGLAVLVVVLVTRANERRGRRERRPDEDGLQRLAKALKEETRTSAGREAARLIELPTTVALNVEPRLELVHDPLGSRIQDGGFDTVEQAFLSARQRLLIVGEAGSGKTISAYQIARLLGDETTDPLGAPIVVNLSAWDDHATFEQFLVDYLTARGSWYLQATRGDRDLVREWVSRGEVALILDGLDEVPAEWRQSCLERLEVWLPERSSVVLTCRTEEFHDLLTSRTRGVRLYLAAELQPLSDSQLADVFTQISDESNKWQQLAKPSKSGLRWAVREALRRPLILNLALSTKTGVDELRAAARGGVSAVSSFVISTYLAKQLRNDPALLRWATWIAAYLRGLQPPGSGSVVGPHDQTVFELSRLTGPYAAWYRAIPTVGVGVALVYAPMVGASFENLFGSAWRPVGVVLGLALSLVMGLAFFTDATPQTRNLVWPGWREFTRGLALGLAAGLALGLLPALALWRREAGGVWLAAALGSGVMFGLVMGLSRALFRRDLAHVSARLNGPWRHSLTGLVYELLYFPLLALAVMLPLFAVEPTADDAFKLAFILAIMVLVGLGFGLNKGGWFLIEQRLLWRRLQRDAGLDRRPLRVLQRGVDHGASRPEATAALSPPLLRQVGSGVRFIHNEVRDALVRHPLIDARDLVPQQSLAEQALRDETWDAASDARSGTVPD